MRVRRDENRMMAQGEIEHRFGVKLGSCPFCGSHNAALYLASEEPHVVCLDCSAEGPAVAVRNTSGDREHAQYKACVAWNGRHVAPTLKPER